MKHPKRQCGPAHQLLRAVSTTCDRPRWPWGPRLIVLAVFMLLHGPERVCHAVDTQQRPFAVLEKVLKEWMESPVAFSSETATTSFAESDIFFGLDALRNETAGAGSSADRTASSLSSSPAAAEEPARKLLSSDWRNNAFATSSKTSDYDGIGLDWVLSELHDDIKPLLLKLVDGDIKSPKQFLSKLKQNFCYDAQVVENTSWRPHGFHSKEGFMKPSIRCTGPRFFIVADGGQVVFPIGTTAVEYFPPSVRLLKIPPTCEIVIQPQKIVQDRLCVIEAQEAADGPLSWKFGGHKLGEGKKTKEELKELKDKLKTYFRSINSTDR